MFALQLTLIYDTRVELDCHRSTNDVAQEARGVLRCGCAVLHYVIREVEQTAQIRDRRACVRMMVQTCKEFG